MSTIANIIWIIFGGLFTAIWWCLAGLLFYITIIGIPLGRQCFKMASLTLAPFDRDALDPALLTASERDWLNGYHRRVYAQIAPLVPTEVRQWLREVTAAL